MEDFEIINYFEDDYQEYWRNEIKRGDWEGCEKLYEILQAEAFKKTFGDNSKLYLVTDGESLICFCAYMEKNEEIASDFAPWIGSVYTFREYRGNGYMQELIDYIYNENIEGSGKSLYVATTLEGFYEKCGFEFVTEKSTSEGTKRILKR